MEPDGDQARDPRGVRPREEEGRGEDQRGPRRMMTVDGPLSGPRIEEEVVGTRSPEPEPHVAQGQGGVEGPVVLVDQTPVTGQADRQGAEGIEPERGKADRECSGTAAPAHIRDRFGAPFDRALRDRPQPESARAG